MDAFAPSLFEWVGSSKAMALRILPSPPPGYSFRVTPSAQVGSEYPSLPLHRATFWLGVLFRFLLNFTGDMSACSEKGRNNMNKGRVYTCVCAYIYERISMLIFSLDPPTTGPGFPQHLRVSVSKRLRIWALHILVEARAWGWISATQTDLSLGDTPKPGVPRVH